MVKKVLDHEFNVSAIGVNSAFLSALICSGITVEKFTFHNFLIAKKSNKEKQIFKILKQKETIVCYESVHKMKDTLMILKKLAPQRNFCLGREISKKYETFYRGNLESLDLSTFRFQGEFVLVIAGNTDKNLINLQDFLNKIKTIDLKNKQIMQLGKIFFGLKHKDLYKIIHNKK